MKNLAFLAFTFLLVSVANAAVINEIRIDQPGADNDEYFELFGTPGESLDSLTYLVIGDGGSGSGTIESVTSLAGLSFGATNYFVAAESTFTLGTADFTTSSLNFENGDNVTHLLVSDFTGANGDDLDTDDDGTLDVTPWSSVSDAVSLVEDPMGGDQFYGSTLGGSDIGPSGTFVPAHVYRSPDGGAFAIGEFDPVGGFDTPGGPNPVAVPEPSTMIGLAALVGGVAYRRRRRS